MFMVELGDGYFLQDVSDGGNSFKLTRNKSGACIYDSEDGAVKDLKTFLSCNFEEGASVVSMDLLEEAILDGYEEDGKVCL